VASKKQKDELRKTLLERKELLEKNIEDGKDNILKLKNLDCKDDMDFAEASSDSFTSELLAVKQSQELEEINAALKALDDGDYGICLMCDEDIEIGRLKAKPFAKYCTPCREIYEKNEN
jgi:DnaK suppressor protein